MLDFFKQTVEFFKTARFTKFTMTFLWMFFILSILTQVHAAFLLPVLAVLVFVTFRSLK